MGVMEAMEADPRKTHIVATPRQADYLLTLWTKTGKLKEICMSKVGGSGSPRDLAQIAPKLREEILGMDSSRISREITEAQQIVGWDPKLASATNRQKTYISYLERSSSVTARPTRWMR